MKCIAMTIIFLALTLSGFSQWQELYRNNNYLRDMYFVNPAQGYVTGGMNYSQLLRTDFYGSDWDTLSTINEQFWGIHFLNEDTGFVISKDASYYNMYKTTDGGNTWNLKYPISPITRHINFPKPECGYAFSGVFSDHWIYKSTDIGETWNQISNFSGSNGSGWGTSESFFFNCDTGFIATDGGDIFKTTDGGISWTNVYSDQNWELGSIIFLDSLNGLAVGYKDACVGLPMQPCNCGIIVRTTDGGVTWIDSIVPYEIYDIDTTRSGKIWIAAYDFCSLDSWIMSSVDSGYNWNIEANNIDYQLLKIQMFNDSTGYALSTDGNGGLILGIGDNLSIKKIDPTDDLIFYPNPSSDFITIENDFSYSEISIFDFSGRLVFAKEIFSGKNILTLNLEAGIYILQMIDKNNIISASKLEIIR